MKRNMKLFTAWALTGVALLSSACSQQPDELRGGESRVVLSVDAQTDFQGQGMMRAINLEQWKNGANYKLSLTDDNGNTVDALPEGSTLGELQSAITLPNGSYYLRAWYGEEKVASSETFLCEGETSFVVNGEDVTSVKVEARPTCGRVAAKFVNMQEQFSDYNVTFHTQALKADNDAVLTINESKNGTFYYVKLNPGTNNAGEEVTAVISATRKSDGKTMEPITKTLTMHARDAWTITLTPEENKHNFTISISIDTTTEDKEVDVAVPGEWI